MSEIEIARGLGRGGFYDLDREDQVRELALHRLRTSKHPA